MNKYKLSIIVPVYNVEKYLERGVESLINQTLKEIEIILVDDGSKDNCGTICDQYAEKFDNIKVIHKENQGLGMARNSGMKVALGEYIGFMDSDDTVEIDFFEKLYNDAKKNDTDVTFGNFKRINGKCVQVHKNNMSKTLLEGEEIINILIKRIFSINNISMSAWGGIYKRSIIDINKIFFCSERKYISEDLIFQLDILPKCNKISILEDAYYNYYTNLDSLTKKYQKDRFERVKNLHIEVCRRMRELNFPNEILLGENLKFIGNVRASIKQEKINSKEEAIKNIDSICKDELVQDVIKTNFDRTLKQKLFDKLIEFKKSKIIYSIIKNKD